MKQVWGPSVVTLTEMIGAQALGPGTSTQRAELINPGSQMGKRKVHQHIDSCYTFTTIHTHDIT